MKSLYEDRQDHIPDLETPPIETFRFMFPGSDTVLLVETSEFTCVCPKTGLPDFATLRIRYRPGLRHWQLVYCLLYPARFRSRSVSFQ